jgi:hypothetical protein
VVHARLSTLAPSASSRTAAVGGEDGRSKSFEDGRSKSFEDGRSKSSARPALLKEGKALGRLYTIAGTAPSRAYSVQVLCVCVGGWVYIRIYIHTQIHTYRERERERERERSHTE